MSVKHQIEKNGEETRVENGEKGIRVKGGLTEGKSRDFEGTIRVDP